MRGIESLFHWSVSFVFDRFTLWHLFTSSHNSEMHESAFTQIKHSQLRLSPSWMFLECFTIFVWINKHSFIQIFSQIWHLWPPSSQTFIMFLLVIVFSQCFMWASSHAFEYISGLCFIQISNCLFNMKTFHVVCPMVNMNKFRTTKRTIGIPFLFVCAYSNLGLCHCSTNVIWICILCEDYYCFWGRRLFVFLFFFLIDTRTIASSPGVVSSKSFSSFCIPSQR